MSERRLSQVLTRRFSRVAWTALAGYAVVVVLLFAVAAEMALRRSLEHSADFIQSLLGAYRDSTSAPGGVMPSALADQLVGMGGQVKRGMRQRELTILAAGDEEQLLDELGRAVDPALHRGEGIPDLGLGPALGGSPLHLRAQVRQGRTQLVTCVRCKGLQRAVRAIHPLEHPVDAVCQIGDFRLPGGTREPCAELGRSDCPGLASHAIEGL